MRRRILIFTYGTRGDVEPFLALAVGLQAAGNDVLLATSKRFRAFAESHGVPFGAMSDASLAAIESPDGRTMLEGGSGVTRRIAAGVRLARESGPINEQLMRETWEAAERFGPEAIVFHPKLFAAPHVAEKLAIPAFLGMLQPMIVPTSEFPAMGLPTVPVPGYNRFTYTLVRRSFAVFRGRINRFRRELLRLPPVRASKAVLFPPGAGTIAVLHAYSPAVSARPGDWPAQATVTGYWKLEKARDYAPPPALSEFLGAGKPPVFVGFGSMTSVNPQKLGQLVTGALRKAGQRGVVAKGWADLEIGDSDDVIGIAPAPYDWLFPRMAAVVHHGGAGTTAEGFYAGVPCVICPFFGDQRGWAKLSVTLGVGADPVPRKQLTAERLADAVCEAVSSARLRENATRLAARLHAEDGVANAVEVISQRLRA